MLSLLSPQHNLQCDEVELAVEHFCRESDKEYNSCSEPQGLFQQTMENIGDIVVSRPKNRFLWLDTNADGKVSGYVLTHLSKDVDNKLCYYMTQAWLHPQFRHTSYAKEAISLLKQHAKSLWCKHIIVVSSRNTKAYLRFLGSKWHVYTTLLKEDI